MPDGVHGRETARGHGGRLLQDADQGRHRKSSGHHFQLAHQRRGGATAGFALSFAGMQLARAKCWLAPPGVRGQCPNRTTGRMSNTLRASLTPHTSSSPALTPGGAGEAPAAGH